MKKVGSGGWVPSTKNKANKIQKGKLRNESRAVEVVANSAGLCCFLALFVFAHLMETSVLGLV